MSKVFKSKNLNKKVVIASIVIFVMAILLLALIFLTVIRFDKKVYKNIYLNGVNMSSYSPKDLVAHVNLLNEEFDNLKISIIQDSEKIYTITPNMIDAKIDINTTVKDVLNYGREKKSFINNLKDIFLARKNKVEKSISITYDEDKMQALLKNIDLTLKRRVEFDSFYVDNDSNKLVLIKGKDGAILDFEQTNNDILSSLKKLDTQDINVKTIDKSSSSLNVDDIYKDVKKDVKDAYLNDKTNPVVFVKEELGVDVDKDVLKKKLDEFKNLEYREKLEIDLDITYPNVYLNDIKYDMYNDKLASYTTYFAGNNKNRSNNIKVSSDYLNDVIIMPGEVFSFNDAVGEITYDKGYLDAATFKGGAVVDGIGGGICQVSSTLYNTALLADLEIVERYNHSMPVSYVLPSRDATIFVGVLDLKFKNTRDYPIKIITSYSPTGSINISIYGTKQEREYEIDLKVEVLEEMEYSTEYIEDPNMTKGKQEVVSSGTNGMVSEAYLVKKLQGKEVEKVFLSRDVYLTVNEVVKIGTK